MDSVIHYSFCLDSKLRNIEKGGITLKVCTAGYLPMIDDKYGISNLK
jgi:hypothetical protein